MKNLRFSPTYFLLMVVLFVIEIFIATIWKEQFFVRAYLRDVFVVMLIYTFVLSFFNIKNKKILILAVFAFAVFIEFLQWIRLDEILGLQPGSAASIALGNSFSWLDILCYFAGCLIIWSAETATENLKIYKK